MRDGWHSRGKMAVPCTSLAEREEERHAAKKYLLMRTLSHQDLHRLQSLIWLEHEQVLRKGRLRIAPTEEGPESLKWIKMMYTVSFKLLDIGYMGGQSM